MRPIRWSLAAFLVVAPLATLPPGAYADNCPRAQCGVVSCYCGDTVVSNFTMNQDVTCSQSNFTGFGLKVASGVSLDGGFNQSTGHPYRVVGPGNPDSSYPDPTSDNYGIWLTAGGATLTNIEVTGFRRGVEIRGLTSGALSNGNGLAGLNIHDNGNFLASNPHGYGVNVVGNNNSIIGVAIDHNADEGIHFGTITGTGANTLQNSSITSSGRENIYLLSNGGNTIRGNTTSHPQTACISSGACIGLYVKDSSGNTIENNNFGVVGAYDRGVNFVDSSSGNLFRNNNIVSSSSFTGRLNVQTTGANTFEGGSISNPGSACVAFSGSTGNVYNKLNRNNFTSCTTQLTTDTAGNTINYCNPPGAPTTSGAFTLNAVSCP